MLGYLLWLHVLTAALSLPTGVLDWLRHANETLAKTQKRVEDHLETKRQAFPRFCFLSNDELLEILAQARLDCLLIAS